MTGTGAVRRRYLNRDEAVSAEQAKEIGTYQAKATHLMIGTKIDFMHGYVLLCAAYFFDVKGTREPVYPGDVADLTGHSESRCAGLLRALRDEGFFSGSAQSGYVLGPKMV